MWTDALRYWLPRFVGSLYAVFLALFATDVFGSGRPFGETVLAFAIHLIPAAIAAGILATAWLRPRVGACLYWLAAAGYVGLTFDQGDVVAWLLIAGPPVLAGLLFWASPARKGACSKPDGG
ncbi:hypothetical protein JCM19992_34090 [Thermostilla marina]